MNESRQDQNGNQMPKRSARRSRAEPGECKFCDTMRQDGVTFHPPHDASANCESGKHAHCTCDTCF